MKQKRFHPADVAILVVVTGLIALLLSQWKAVPRRTGPGGLFEDADLWSLKDEAALRTMSATTNPFDWLMRATYLADTYGMLGRHAEELELLEKCLPISEGMDKGGARRVASAGGGGTPPPVTAPLPDTQRTAELVSALGEVYARAGRAEEALPLQQRELRNVTARSTSNRDRAGVLADIAASERALGLNEEALSSLRQALRIKFPRPSRAGDYVEPRVRQWLQDYRELLIKTGKGAEEADTSMRHDFGQSVNSTPQSE